MGNKKKTPKAKEPIKLRWKKIANGNLSAYLDYYSNGKREYEYLRLYQTPEQTPFDKEANAKTLRLANAVKAQRVVELQNNAHGFSNKGTRSKVNVVEYITTLSQKKREAASGGSRSNANGHLSLAKQIEAYSGARTTFKQVDKQYCEGFIEFLKTVKSKKARTKEGTPKEGTPLTENTQVTYLKLFTIAINEAIRNDIINDNPFNKINKDSKPQQKTANRCFLTIDELKKLKKTPLYNNDIKNAFLFCCYSGLRFSDVKALMWKNLQKDNAGEWQISHVQQKTQKQEYLFIPKQAFEYVSERGKAKDTDRIFSLSSGGHTNSALKAWAYSAGIEKHLTFHVSRHTYATILLSKGAAIETVSKLLGHSDIQTTQIYAKIIDENKRKAVNLLNDLMD